MDTRSGTLRRHRNQWERAHSVFGETLRRELRIAESGEAPKPCTVDERLVQCIWFDQLVRSGELATASGKRVEVVEPGRWNTGRGPDFLDAKIALAGETLEGDVEIHIQSNGWTAHGHHQDYEYNRVVLHVCLNAGDDRPYEEKQNGERLERLLLADVLEPDLETIRRTISVDDYPYGRPADTGLCHRNLMQLPPERLSRFLEVAGRARIEDKVARYRAQMASASVPQLIYQSVMVGQGYKSNKTLYFLLSKRAPLAELIDYSSDVSPRERSELYLSILLHVAQLFPTQPDLFDGADDETRGFAERAMRLWRPVRGYFADRIMPPTKRWYSGMRPPGFPGRRLSAVAILLDRLNDGEKPLFGRLCSLVGEGLPAGDQPKVWRGFLKECTDALVVADESSYFATHFTIGGKPSKPQALLGEPAARSLLFNVFLPLIALSGEERVRDNAWRVVERFPALPKNSVTEFMQRRLFAESGLEKSLLRRELMQQALFKVFHDCCAGNERTCDSCTFLNAPYAPAE